MNAIARFSMAVALAAFSAATLASPASSQSGTVSLIRLEHAWQHAVLSGDSKALDKILATRFLDTSWQGQLRDKAEVLASASKPPNWSDAALSDMRARIFGNTGIVTGLNTVIGPHHAWTARIRFTDVFLKQAGRWRAIGAQEDLLRSDSRNQK